MLFSHQETALDWQHVNAWQLSQQPGNTPLLRLRRITAGLPESVQVFAKAEWHNPSGSVKDRPALNILRTALRQGDLQVNGNRRLLDSTSGNMGIAYATYGAALQIGVTLVMPAHVSPERRAILRALGAEIILTDVRHGEPGPLSIVRQMAAAEPARYWYANQYDNPANWQAHFQGTGPEIWQQTKGQITHFVAGTGTSGTLTGVSRYLRTRGKVHVTAVQPMIARHGLEGLKYMHDTTLPGIYDPSLADEIVTVDEQDVRRMVRRLAREEGLFVGISSAAAALAAMRVAKSLSQGVVVTVFPDAGFKYLSDDSLWQPEEIV